MLLNLINIPTRRTVCFNPRPYTAFTLEEIDIRSILQVYAITDTDSGSVHIRIICNGYPYHIITTPELLVDYFDHTGIDISKMLLPKSCEDNMLVGYDGTPYSTKDLMERLVEGRECRNLRGE